MELDVVLVHGVTTLLQVPELLTHLLHEAGRNVVGSEVTAELIPSDHSSTPGILQLLPPDRCLPLQLECCKLDEILWTNIAAFKVLVHVTDPILSIKRLVTGSESLWLI